MGEKEEDEWRIEGRWKERRRKRRSRGRITFPQRTRHTLDAL
jgi:hypothetical protein